MKESEQNIGLSMMDTYVAHDIGLFFYSNLDKNGSLSES